jgi:hypothetical protein
LVNTFTKIARDKPAKIALIGFFLTIAWNNLLQEILKVIISKVNKKIIIYGKGPIILLIKKYFERNRLIGDDCLNIDNIETVIKPEKLELMRLKFRNMIEKSQGKRKIVIKIAVTIFVCSYIYSFICNLAFLTLINMVNDLFDQLFENLFAEDKIGDTLYDEIANEIIRKAFKF